MPQVIETLAEDGRAEFSRTASEWLGYTTQQLSYLEQLEGRAVQREVIENLTPERTGAFTDLIADIESVIDGLIQLKSTSTTLEKDIEVSKLSPLEERLRDAMNTIVTDNPTDIIDWLKSSGLNDEEFWVALRGLQNKRHVMLFAQKIRR